MARVEGRVDSLRKAATDMRLSQEERKKAIDELRRLAQGGASGLECIAARNALAELSEPEEFGEYARPVAPTMAPTVIPSTLELDLLAQTKARTLGDIEYEQVHEFCRARNWSPEAMALYQKWAGNNPETLHTVLRLYLTMHGESRNEAKFLLKNLNGRWPAHWVDRKALEAFIERKPECEDARRVVQHFLDHGEPIEHLPQDCDCWKLRDAIKRAANETNPDALFKYLADSSRAA